MDIVERLREGKSAGGYWREKEAADEIERLREALRQVADFDLYGDYSNAYRIPEIARSALQQKEIK